MDDHREELLDQLARVYARAAVDAYLVKLNRNNLSKTAAETSHEERSRDTLDANDPPEGELR